MKLTESQIITLEAALADYIEKTEGRALAHPEGTFWKEENATALGLKALFEKAIRVEVESAQLDDHACGDIHCDGKHCAPVTPATAAEPPLELPPEVSALLEFPLMPEVEFSARLQSLQNSLQSEPSAAAPNGALEGWADQTQDAAPALSTDPVQLPAVHSIPEQSASPALSLHGSSAQSAAEASPSPGSKVSPVSSAEPSQEPAPYKPALLSAIDLTESLEEALDLLGAVTVFARTLVASHLNISLDQLTDAITRRVRARLLQPA